MTPPSRERRKSGRLIVGIGVVAGIFCLVVSLVSGWNLAAAFLTGLGGAVVTMIAVGVGQAFWQGRRVNQANLPGGAGVGFEEVAAETAEQVNERITEQMDDVNERLFELEKKSENDESDG